MAPIVLQAKDFTSNVDMAYGHVHYRYHFSEGNDDDLIR